MSDIKALRERAISGKPPLTKREVLDLIDDIERRAAAEIASLRARLAEVEWQPIESAPRDGMHILAYQAPIGIRVTNQTNPPTVVHWFDDPDEPGFYTSVNELAPEHPFDATHWRPLPAAPQPSGKGGE